MDMSPSMWRADPLRPKLPLVFETLNSVPSRSGGVGACAEFLLAGYAEIVRDERRGFGFLDTWQGERHWGRDFPAYRFLYDLPSQAHDEAIVHFVSAFRSGFRNSGRMLERCRKTHCFATHHDFIDLDFPSLFSAGELRIRRDAYRALRDYCGVVTPSRGVADRLVAEFEVPANRIRVIPHGNDRHSGLEPNLGRRYDFRYVLAVGKIYPHKNWGRLFAACAGAAKAFRDNGLRLVFLSSDLAQQAGRLNEIRAKLGLDDVLEFHGYASNREMEALFRHADGFVFPSLAEGFGIPLFEAQALGLPVCVSDLPVFRELLALADYSAETFDPLSVRDMASALDRFLNGIGAGAPRPAPFVRSWRQVASEHLEFFDAVVGANEAAQ